MGEGAEKSDRLAYPRGRCGGRGCVSAEEEPQKDSAVAHPEDTGPCRPQPAASEAFVPVFQDSIVSSARLPLFLLDVLWAAASTSLRN